MRAMVLHDTAPIEEAPLQLEDWPAPEPAPNELLVRVQACGVCRTDLHVIEGDLPKETLPIIPGHQVVGTVAARGAECTRFEAGARVGVAWLRHTCGACDFCQRGQENLCEASRYTGYHAHGGYADYAVVPEDYAYAIPDGFDDIAAAPLLCAGIIGYRALRRCNPPEGGSLALYGFGSSAHIVAQIARHRGLRLYVVTRGENHQRQALDLGAEWAGDDPAKMPAPADAAILFAPVGHLVPPALEHLHKGGTLSLAGIHMSDVPAMNYERHLFYERNIHSVTANTREDGRALLEEAAAARVTPDTTTYPLEDANRALQDMKASRINGSAVLRMG